MSVLRVIKKVKVLSSCKHLNLRLQSTELSVKPGGKTTKTRRFLKPHSEIELKPFNINFVAAVFGKSFDKDILEYPQVFEEKDTDTVISHTTALEKFLINNPKLKLNKQTLPELNALELLGLSIPQEYGGAGYNRTEISFLLECAGIESQVGRFLGCNEDFGCRLLSIYGNEEQKAKYLPMLAGGQSSMTLAYLEKGSMIDFSNFEGYAIRDSENKGYILNTNKKWVHHADVSDLILVLAKTTSLLEEEEASLVKYSMFIVQKKTPGLTVHKMLTNNMEDASFYDIDISEAFISEKDLLGSPETCGITVLKSALSHSFLTDATLCCSLTKQLLNEAIDFIHENKILEKLDKGYIMAQNNISSLTMYIFVLESVIYLISGRFDTHKEHDLFEESVLGKIIAIEMLKCSIQKYIEITGCESLRTSGILEEALKTLHYYSVVDENIEFLKMMVGGSGLCHASLPLSEKVKKLRNVPDNFSFTIKEIFKKIKTTNSVQEPFKLRLELHSSLQSSANLLEKSIIRFLETLENNFLHEGRAVVENESIIIKFAEIVAYLYAVTACLSRASSTACYNFDKPELEVALADKFTYMASHKIDCMIDEEVEFINLILLYREISKNTFENKGYPAQHPLTRAF